MPAVWRAAARGVAAQLRRATEEVVELLKTATESPLQAEERALLAEFDRLTPSQRKAIFLGTPGDEKAAAYLEKVRDLMSRMLTALRQARGKVPGAAAPKRDLRVIGGSAKMGQRSGAKQAKLFFDKLLSTGGRKGFFKEEPIPITLVDPDTGKIITRSRTLAEWRKSTTLVERMRRVLKYSAMPGLSRHHWGTDVDVGSVKPKTWQPDGRLGPLGRWLEANRDVLPLKTAYSGKRDGGYQDEAWHLTMGILGPGMHARFNAQMDMSTKLIPAIVKAFDGWAASSKLPDGVIGSTRDVLVDALGALGLEKYIGSVNSDVQPERTL